MIPQPKTKGNAPVKARFFKLGNKDMIEIAIIGDHNTYQGKVTKEDMARFPREWEAYQAGLDMPEVEGTPLIEVPGMNEQLVQWYKFQGIHVAEQLASASDIVIQKLGMGGNVLRRNAEILIKSKAWEKREKDHQDALTPPKGHAAQVDEPKRKASKHKSEEVAPEVPRQ